MTFLGKAWKVVVGIKDFLVLIFMLLFFMALFGLLSATPNPGQVREGALYIDLSGYVVEERAAVDPLATLLSGEAPIAEHQARDLVRAIDAAAGDDRISAVVLDMTRFAGGGQVHLQAIGEAMDRVRKSEKPVLTYSLAYGDDHMHLAAHASEVWVDPLGGAMIVGPGGTRLYYAALLERLNINTRVYRVGEFKSAVEPYILDAPSPAALENQASLYGSLWEEWQANVTKARPQIELERVTNDSVAWIEASSGDFAEAALDAGLVDQLGDRVAFGERVAEIVGEDDWSDDPGAYAKSDLAPYLADIGPADTGSGGIVAVVTVAGTIVDGNAGPGTAGGSRIAGLLDDALGNEDIKGLVVRVDSPGGSVLASEEIRLAIQRFGEKEVPVAISFANVAASGGYWVATAGDRIFAQPETITGSIGVFAVIPTFEDAAEELGVNADGFRTTPLSGQPDLVAGFSPEVDAILQASVENTYADFLERVASVRGLSLERVNEIGQGRVWDGGTAHQHQLIDQFGGAEEAIAWVAQEAGIEEGNWTTKYLGNQEASYDSLVRQMLTGGIADPRPATNVDMFALTANAQQAAFGQILQDAKFLAGTRGVQAYCMECPTQLRPITATERRSVLQLMAGLFGS